MKKLLMIPVALLMSTASAAPQISAQSIIVNPVQPDLSVKVRVNKDSTGRANPTYLPGENITITTTTNRDAYVYLFNVDAKGEVTQILPNRLGGSNFVKANVPRMFPGRGAGFTFEIGPDLGLNKVLALASTKQLNLGQLSSFKNSQDKFATVGTKGQAGLAQALSIVVKPIPPKTWVTDTASYTTISRNPVKTGNLFVGTNVADATVLLNNQNLGKANRTYSNLRPGSYNVRVRARGFSDYMTKVTIRPNATTNVNVQFAPPAPVNYSLTLRSVNEGARAFVNGEEKGIIRGGKLALRVPAGVHEVVLIQPGYRTSVNSYRINKSGQITINLRR